MPAVKKNAAATSAAIQNGLTVKSAPVKATKAAAKTVRTSRVTKAADSVKVTKDATGAVTGLVGPRKAVRKAAPAKVAAPAPVVLFTDDVALKVAAAAVKKHLTANVADLFGDNHLTARKTAIRNADAFWAQANRNIIKNGVRVVNRGDWFVALDFSDDSPMGLTTAIVSREGAVVRHMSADATGLDSFTYLTA